MPEDTLPDRSGLNSKPPFAVSFTYFEALFPLRIRSQPTRVTPRQRPILSGFLPFRVFS